MIRNLLALIFAFGLFAEEKITTHEKPFPYTATVSTNRKVTYISYVKESKENRPITFAFNGGPGGSSSYLHLGSLGPRRLVGPEEGGKLNPPYQLVDNLETILDITDLVFVDPPGTGLSESDISSYTITGDIETIATFIRNYLTENGRWNSPKYLAGESYGATRSAGVAEYLQNEYGIYLNGLILISAAIDFQVFIFDEDNQLPYFLYLPTYAATAWYHKKANNDLPLQEVVENARDFAYQTYAPALFCPKCRSIETLYSDLISLTGLPPDVVESSRGKISDMAFATNLLRDERKTLGMFDARAAGPSASPHDPSSALIEGALSAAFHEYLHKELGIKDSYTLFSYHVNRQWDFHDYNQWGYPSLMKALRSSLNVNPSMKVFVACGLFDLVTPFATVEYCFDHLEIPEATVQMEYYEGGHMFYFNPQARMKFKQDLTQFYR